MHIFNEQLLVDNKMPDSWEESSGRLGAVVDRSKDVIFSDKYFIVLIEKGPEGDRLTGFAAFRQP